MALDWLPALMAIAALSWLLVYGLRVWAQRRQILAIPNQRSSHNRPVPLGGGAAIVVVALAVGAWELLRHGYRWDLLAYLLGGLLIATISWLDDLRSLGALVRFACHLLAAILVVASRTVTLPLFGLTVPSWLVGLGLVLWIVGLTNVYNFMDGIDGLAGSQAVVTSLWWATIGVMLDLPAITALGLALAAGSLGFLLHNWPPARVFMGDVGSAFLGYSFAVFPLLGWAPGRSWLFLIGGAFAVWPFLFDGTLTIIRRGFAGENIFQAHRSHLYQRLVIAGWSHRAVTLLYCAFAGISAYCGYGLAAGGWPWLAAVVPPSLGALLFMAVRRIEHDSGIGTRAR